MSLLSQFFTGGGVTLENTRTVEIFAVGGGGGGGGGYYISTPDRGAGGGGGGGQVLYQQVKVSIGVTYTISIGAGGAAGVGSTNPSISRGGIGNNTTFGDITCYGGGGGGSGYQPDLNTSPTIRAYGSEGGYGGHQSTKNSSSILGWFPGFTSPGRYSIPGPMPRSKGSTINVDSFTLQSSGKPSTYVAPTSDTMDASGGGGALMAGPYEFGELVLPFNSTITFTSPGGDGIPAEYIGISTFVVGGGGGGGDGYPGPPFSGAVSAQGGLGGGGDGADNGGINATNGTANTGGGGGGTFPGVSGPQAIGSTAGSGGSGTIIVRFPTQYSAATVTGNAPAPSQPGFYVYRWTSGPGSITFN